MPLSPKPSKSNNRLALQIVQHVANRPVKPLRVRPPIVLAGPVGLVDKEDINGISTEQPEALFHRAHQAVAALRVERLGSPTQFSRENDRRTHPLQRAAQNLFAVRIP